MVFIIKSAKLENIFTKKAELDLLVKSDPKTFDHLLLNWFRTEVTYSSNAIEGNTLSKMQTEAVINDGITISGKTINEHIEAINHANAYDFMMSISKSQKDLTENDILEIHALILKNIDNQNAGRYRNIPVRISGSSTILPNHQKVSSLMSKLIGDLHTMESCIHQALFLHYQFVTIHPFIDGNGRTARLLMNKILINNGYPPVMIKKSDRVKYLHSLEIAPTRYVYEEYINLLLRSIEKSLDICIKHYLSRMNNDENTTTKVMKIGELSRLSKVPTSTIRHWVKSDIIRPHDTTDSGYFLFTQNDVEICNKILELQKQRMTLKEIKSLIKIDWK